MPSSHSDIIPDAPVVWLSLPDTLRTFAIHAFRTRGHAAYGRVIIDVASSIPAVMRAITHNEVICDNGILPTVNNVYSQQFVATVLSGQAVHGDTIYRTFNLTKGQLDSLVPIRMPYRVPTKGFVCRPWNPTMVVSASVRDTIIKSIRSAMYAEMYDYNEHYKIRCRQNGTPYNINQMIDKFCTSKEVICDDINPLIDGYVMRYGKP